MRRDAAVDGSGRPRNEWRERVRERIWWGAAVARLLVVAASSGRSGGPWHVLPRRAARLKRSWGPGSNTPARDEVGEGAVAGEGGERDTAKLVTSLRTAVRRFVTS